MALSKSMPGLIIGVLQGPKLQFWDGLYSYICRSCFLAYFFLRYRVLCYIDLSQYVGYHYKSFKNSKITFGKGDQTMQVFSNQVYFLNVLCLDGFRREFTTA